MENRKDALKDKGVRKRVVAGVLKTIRTWKDTFN